MKIKFTDRKFGLEVSLNEEYQVLGYYTDWIDNENDWHRIVFFLDNNGMPQTVNATYNKDIILDDSTFPFETTTEYFQNHESTMPKEWNLQNRTQIDVLDYRWDQLRLRHIWAITQFVEGLEKMGIQANADLTEIARNEKIKIWYVKGIINGIFETMCNYFAGCSNTQYAFSFDQIPIDSSITVAENVVKVFDYKTELYQTLYRHLVEFSSFGIFLYKNSKNEESMFLDELMRACLKDSIKRITLTVESIFSQAPELSVFEEKLAYPWEYCLYFLTKDKMYKFYLANLD